MSITALLACHYCGGTLTFQTEGGNSYERRAVLCCDACCEQHVLIARLVPTKGTAA